MKTAKTLSALILFLSSLCLIQAEDGTESTATSTNPTPKPEVVNLNFGTEIVTGEDLPAWFLGVQQNSGVFLPNEGGWAVPGASSFGAGRLDMVVDRSVMSNDLALTLFYYENNADLAIQLYDDEDRVIAVDLFANVVQINEEAKTDTAIIPLSKYPTATKIAIRRLQGDINVQGAVLFPVLSEANVDEATLKKLASLLGDPLSPDNPLLTGFASGDRVSYEQMVAAQENNPEGRNSGIKVVQEQFDGNETKKTIELNIKGIIDGSEEIHIYQDSAEWIHKHWRRPKEITLNDVEWNVASTNVLWNSGETQFLSNQVKFASAQVLLASGRDVCAMVPSKDKIIVFLSDSPNGANFYEMRISFEVIEAGETKPSVLAPKLTKPVTVAKTKDQ